MKEKFTNYLRTIGMTTEVILKRIETIYEFYKEMCPDEIMDIFVTDYIKEDGTREYENLWFFSDKYCMESKQFITKDEFDIALIKKISYVRIKKQDYDFKKAIEKSRIILHVGFEHPITGEIKASKENCDFLKVIFLKYVKPNLNE